MMLVRVNCRDLSCMVYVGISNEACAFDYCRGLNWVYNRDF